MLKFMVFSLIFGFFMFNICAKSAKEPSRPPEPKSCFEPKMVRLDENWIETSGKQGWYVPLQSKMKSTPESPSNPNSPHVKAKNYSKTRCSLATYETKLTDVDLAYRCKYTQLEHGHCGLDDSDGGTLKGLQAAANIKFFGEFWGIFSNNLSYVVSVGCMFDSVPSWLVLSTKEKLEKNEKDDIFKHVSSLGFDTTKLGDKNEDLFIMTRLKTVDCPDTPKAPDFQEMLLGQGDDDEGLL